MCHSYEIIRPNARVGETEAVLYTIQIVNVRTGAIARCSPTQSSNVAIYFQKFLERNFHNKICISYKMYGSPAIENQYSLSIKAVRISKSLK